MKAVVRASFRWLAEGGEPCPGDKLPTPPIERSRLRVMLVRFETERGREACNGGSERCGMVEGRYTRWIPGVGEY